MNRLDATTVPEPPEPTIPQPLLLTGTWLVPLAGVCGAIYFGHAAGDNPVDRFYLSCAVLPLGLAPADIWALLIAVFRRNTKTPLRVPWLTPVLLLVLHLAIGLGARALTDFDRLYTYVPTDDLGGFYAIRTGIAGAILAGAVFSVGLSLLEVQLVRWVLISERTAQPAASPEVVEDRDLGGEHVYEAQALLNNLGYATGVIDGVLSEETAEALRGFQASADIEVTGRLTALTMIELRNRWGADGETEARASLRAILRHVGRRMMAPYHALSRGLKRSSS